MTTLWYSKKKSRSLEEDNDSSGLPSCWGQQPEQAVEIVADTQDRNSAGSRAGAAAPARAAHAKVTAPKAAPSKAAPGNRGAAKAAPAKAGPAKPGPARAALARAAAALSAPAKAPPDGAPDQIVAEAGAEGADANEGAGAEAAADAEAGAGAAPGADVGAGDSNNPSGSSRSTTPVKLDGATGLSQDTQNWLNSVIQGMLFKVHAEMVSMEQKLKKEMEREISSMKAEIARLQTTVDHLKFNTGTFPGEEDFTPNTGSMVASEGTDLVGMLGELLQLLKQSKQDALQTNEAVKREVEREMVEQRKRQEHTLHLWDAARVAAKRDSTGKGGKHSDQDEEGPHVVFQKLTERHEKALDGFQHIANDMERKVHHLERMVHHGITKDGTIWTEEQLLYLRSRETSLIFYMDVFTLASHTLDKQHCALYLQEIRKHANSFSEPEEFSKKLSRLPVGFKQLHLGEIDTVFAGDPLDIQKPRSHGWGKWLRDTA